MFLSRAEELSVIDAWFSVQRNLQMFPECLTLRHSNVFMIPKWLTYLLLMSLFTKVDSHEDTLKEACIYINTQYIKGSREQEHYEYNII